MFFSKFVANRIPLKYVTNRINTFFRLFFIFEMCCVTSARQYIVLASAVLRLLLLPMMNGFNKTEAAIFLMQAMVPLDFLLFSD